MVSFNVTFQEHDNRFDVEFGQVTLLSDIGETYILSDDFGNEVVAVLVDNEVIFDATANDIRIGKVAATEEGVTTGTKEIPSYNTVEGNKIIMPGKQFILTGQDYDYTKLQALICDFNTSLRNSVSTEQVAIDNAVYAVESTTVVATLTKHDDKEAIDFGVSNNSTRPKVIRYVYYREIY